jgi:hypothetical protein
LLAVSGEKSDDLVTELRKNYPQAQVVGRVMQRTGTRIVVR